MQYFFIKKKSLSFSPPILLGVLICATFPEARAADETGIIIESNDPNYKNKIGEKAQVDGTKLGQGCYVRVLGNNETRLVEGPKARSRPVGGTRSINPEPDTSCSK